MMLQQCTKHIYALVIYFKPGCCIQRMKNIKISKCQNIKNRLLFNHIIAYLFFVGFSFHCSVVKVSNDTAASYPL